MIRRWPEDMEFKRFAAKLADAVMFAIHSGIRLAPYDTDGNEETENCPIGCLVGSRFPTNYMAVTGVPGLSIVQSREFVSGFDRGVVSRDPYNRLGRAYRERFVK